MVVYMKLIRSGFFLTLPVAALVSGVGFLAAPCVMAEPSAAAASAFHQYEMQVEGRLERERHGAGIASMQSARNLASLRRGEFLLEKLTPEKDPIGNGAMLHHWRATAFVPGAHAAEFERVMKDFNSYPQIYAPQVLHASIQNRQPDHFQTLLRVRQKHILTVVLDTAYSVDFGRINSSRGYSLTHSTAVSEIADPGGSHEHALSGKEEHGFLWRQNSYWSYEEHDGGLWLQLESLTLTRAIPTGLGWAIQPFIESVPRESLEFTLQSTARALHKP
jgi:hypothetical protein